MAPENNKKKGKKNHPYKKDGAKNEYNPNRYCNKCGKLVLGFVSKKQKFCGSCGHNFQIPIPGMVDCRNCRNLLNGNHIYFKMLSAFVNVISH